MTLAAAHGWKPQSRSGKKNEGYGDLAELEAMFADTGGIIT